jgi:hypothetical protein
MPIRRGKPLTFRAKGLTDAIDGSNAFAGSMQSLQNLIPNPTTAQQWVPRPASLSLINFAGSPIEDVDGNPILDSDGNPIYDTGGGFTSPAQIEAIYVVGERIYGMIASGRFVGKSEPFCYDLSIGAFVTIGGVTAANTPASQPRTGDWTPPTMQMIANKIVITHPGYDGVTNFIGWIDVSSFSFSGAATGNTNTSTTITDLSEDVLTLGWAVGQLISDAAGDIRPGTYITGIGVGGTTVTISQAARATTPGTTFTVSGGTTAAPLYGAGQTAPIALAAVPVAVSQFNGRAYYAVLNGVTLSDSLTPLTISGAGGTFVPTLTMGDSDPVTALAGVPLANQVIGGTIQSLIAFKGAGLYYQVTGDPATTDLASNAVEGSVGTNSPNSIAATPQGIAYIAPDGLRFIGFTGQSSNPIGADGQGVSVPFQYAINPTRIAGAYNQNVYRVSVQNGFVNGQPNEEYWYDFNLQIWSGPHTFPAALITPIYQPANAFVSVGVGIDGVLWQSSVLPAAGSTYIENGVQLASVWQPSLLPDNQAMAMNSSPQGTLGLSLPSALAITVTALDEEGNILDSIVLAGTGAGGSVWGAFNWGAMTWGAAVTPFRQYTLPWHEPLVFKQGTLRVTMNASAGFVIGNAYLQYVELGYVGAAAA